jgi:hypothetical protein
VGALRVGVALWAGRSPSAGSALLQQLKLRPGDRLGETSMGR